MILRRLKAIPLGAQASPWLIIGFSLILVAVVTTLAVVNAHREERNVRQILLDKGGALIRAFEAGARTGMMGHLGQGAEVQTLLEETAQQEGILYLVLTDQSGRILAHSDRERIGERFMPQSAFSELRPSQDEQWRMAPLGGGAEAFEVYKNFTPLEGGAGSHDMNTGMGEQGHHGGNASGFWCAGDTQWPRRVQPGVAEEEPIIFVGLDPEPFEHARWQDLRITLIISAVLLLLGFAGVVSLYWAQSYRASRRLLQDTRALAAEVVSSLPAALLVLDPQGRISLANESAEELFGTRHCELVGRPVQEVLPAELGRLLDDTGATHSAEAIERELDATIPGRGRVPVSASVSRIVTEDGHGVGTVLTLRDLSEIRQLQEELRRKEKLAAVGRLAAGVAHEIRNPLSSIKGFATYFGGLFEEGSENKESARIMIREVDRLNRVITELLEYTRPMEIKPAAVDVTDLVAHSLRLVREDARVSGVDVRYTPNGPLPARLDPDRISQALLNLLLNAIQAMDTGGALDVGLARKGRHLTISVRDTGKGIAPEDVGRIFDPYFTTKPKGTGLGLAIVQKIVEAHGGEIAVESEPGQGSTFTMMLPDQAGTTSEAA
ncbi:ATP-binding protein [Desulfocurvibacter africanus]|uniref:ATP-binding protein n=1 Tax=Desulfocurvibacter africanus TaxID=873 RepID=UPI00041B176B|nr:ATP-binding protein [Desulfocurvibacter africanus]